jgi:hypothetical protein
MLSRPPDAKSALRRARKRRYRERCAAGLAVCPVEHDDKMIQFLIETHWLAEGDADDPRKVGAAVSVMWRDSARRENS